jgi:hypothetical protein
MKDMMLTTIDNPFDPFVQWDQWKRFDEDMKYFTCNYLARIAKTSDDLSDADYSKAVDDAINEIVSFNINGMYRKTYSQINIDDRGGV